MPFTYDDSKLATTPVYQVRFEIGDTDSAAPMLQDEEILYALSVERNTFAAAARCCETISRKFLAKADVRVGRGGTMLTYSTAARQYADMAAALRKRATGITAPWAGGTSVDDKKSLSEDASRVQPIFTKTSGNNPWIGREDLDPINDGQTEA